MTRIRKPIAVIMILLITVSAMPAAVLADEIPEQETASQAITDEQTAAVQEEEQEPGGIPLPEEEASGSADPPQEEEDPGTGEIPEEEETEAVPEESGVPSEESGAEIIRTEGEAAAEQEEDLPAYGSVPDPEEEETDSAEGPAPDQEPEETSPAEEAADPAEEPQEEEDPGIGEVTDGQEEPVQEEKVPVPCVLTVTLMDVRDSIIIRKNGETAASVFGNYAPGSGSYYLAGPDRLTPMAADPDGCTRLRLDALTGDIFSIEVFEPGYGKIYYSSSVSCDTGNTGGYTYCCLQMQGDAEVTVNGDYSASEGYFAVGAVRSARKAGGGSWSPPDALYVSLGSCYSDYSSTAIVNGHTGVYFFQPEEQGEGHFISATCGSTTKHMQSGVHYKVARIAELSARAYLDYGSGCCSQRAQRALAWITHHGQSEYDWRRYSENRFVMGDDTIWVANQLEAYTITFLAAWVCTNDGRVGSYGTVHAEDGAHALDFMFGSSFSNGLPASTRSAIDSMVAKGLAFADAHPDQDGNVPEYQETFVYSDGDGSHQPLLIGAYQGERNGSLSITKRSSMPSYTDGNAMYSFEGTAFQVKDSSGSTAGTLTADASGKTSSLDLPAGTYTVTETKAGKGYIRSTETVSVTVNAGESKTVSFTNVPVKDPGMLQIRKWDRETDRFVPQGNGSFAGARYRLDYYDNTSCSGTPKASWVFRTDAEGKIEYLPSYKVSGPDLYRWGDAYLLPLGSIKITEVSAPAGYLMSADTLCAAITQEGDRGVFRWTDETQGLIKAYADGTGVPEKVIRGGVRFRKTDAETGEPVQGAEISVYSACDAEVLVNGALYRKGDLILTLTTKADGTCETAKDLLPYGSYCAVETKAPEGYILNSGWRVDFDITEDGKVLDLTSGSNVLKDQKIRGDLSMLKLDMDGSYKPGIPFMIVQIGEDGEEGEWHVIVSDETGRIGTSASARAHTKDTNSLDGYVSGGVFTDASKLDPAVGVWFGESQPDDSLGALPYGRYKVYELQTRQLAAEQVNILESGITEIREPGETVELTPMVNLNIDLRSEAASGCGKDFIPASAVRVTDTVYYTNLTAGRRYTMETLFLLKSTSEVLAAVSEDFYPAAEEVRGGVIRGSVTLEAQIDVSDHPGDAVVACDHLYEYVKGSKVLVASHADMEDKAQTLRIPSIRTAARDPETGDNVGTVSENAQIIDTVWYSNLKRGEVFKLTAKLGDPETGEPLKGEDGEDLTVEKRFVCSSETGSIDMPAFRIDSTLYAGRSVVVLEELYWIDEDSGNAEILLASHTAYDDADQTVTYPDVRTSAADAATESHAGTVSGETAVKDEVRLSGLIPGKEYTVSGKLVWRDEFADGENRLHRAGDPVPVREGSETEVTFTADSAEMTVTLTYFPETGMLEGHAAVVFEDLIHNGAAVASHADLADEDQTVRYPSLKTRAKDKTSGTPFISKGTEVFLTDTVDCGNLVPGERYVIRGRLIDRDTGDELGYTAESEAFTAEQEDETHTVEFTVDAEKIGSGILVVFEDLYLLKDDGTEVLAVRHEDLNDEDQALYSPGIRTAAANAETGTHEAQAGPDTVLADTVYYTYLKTGEQYTVTGILMDRDTGAPLLTDGEPVTSEVTFVTEEKDGLVTLFFDFGSAELAGKTAVAFERLLYEGREIAAHEDIEDEEQSVNMIDIRTSAADAGSGTHTASLSRAAEIVDTVTYTGLMPGKTYTLYGRMMAKGTGGEVYLNDVPVTGMTVFVPEEPDGTAQVIFTLDTYILQGMELAVFERLYAGNMSDGSLESEVPIAVHEDLNDEEQTIMRYISGMRDH